MAESKADCVTPAHALALWAAGAGAGAEGAAAGVDAGVGVAEGPDAAATGVPSEAESGGDVPAAGWDAGAPPPGWGSPEEVEPGCGSAVPLEVEELACVLSVSSLDPPQAVKATEPMSIAASDERHGRVMWRGMVRL